MDGHKPFYRLSVDESLAELRSSADGLPKAEAADRLTHLGSNQLELTPRSSVPLTFLRQFRSPLILILLVSACLSLSVHSLKTAFVLLAIALVNAAVGYFQEHKTTSPLEQPVVPHAKVLRRGKVQKIAGSELVPGDVIYLEAGDRVPADARVLTEDGLATNDFALTGASQPIRKFTYAISADVPIAFRHNMVSMGTTVATGNGHALVVSTGMATELGRIVDLSQSAHADTPPLQREMHLVATRLAQGTLVLAALLAVIQLQTDIGLKTTLLFGISIAAAMIPNGLVAGLHIILTQTAARLARTRALIKKLSAIETLGATDVIITDDIGTLTKNELTATRVLIGREQYTVSGAGYELNGAVCDAKGKPIGGQKLKNLHLFFETGALASNAEVNPPDDEHTGWYAVGDPTEGALITLARKAGLEPTQLKQAFPERKEYAFDSARKRMTSVREVDGQLYAFVKGAPESILACSTSLWDHGHTRDLTTADRTFFAKYNDEHAEEAERNLAFAYRVLPKGFDPTQHQLEDAEQDLTFLGIVSTSDPLRNEVPAAMRAALKAHVPVSIITGDYPATAEAVARKAGLNGGDITVVMDDELPSLSDTQVLTLLSRGGAVFSRVSPEDKLRIVNIAKAGHHVVAVTGDGINDAPALKRADIGVAMGIAGTDVAKDTAEIVLLDDSFGTLMTTIAQGRLTLQNIRHAVRGVLADNTAELITILISLAATVLWDIPAAITAIQILAIDIAAQLLPLTALGWDPARSKLMLGPPGSVHDRILNRQTARSLITFGLLAAILAYANYLLYFPRHHISPLHLGTASEPYLQASILTLTTIVCCQFINLLLVRSDNRLFTRYLWSNKKLLAAFVISAFFILNIVYNPLLQPYFGSGPLTGYDWLTVLAAGTLYTLIRLFHLHTKHHSRRTLIEKHGAPKLRAHLQKA